MITFDGRQTLMEDDSPKKKFQNSAFSNICDAIFRFSKRNFMEGSRWIENKLVYTRRWEEEDKSKTPLEVTIGVLRDSMMEVINYLTFTYESG